MLSPETAHAIDGSPANTLMYWLKKSEDKGRRPCEYYCTYHDVDRTVDIDLVLHPRRACLVKYDGRQILVANPKRYKGRGWLQRYTEDVELAILNLVNGHGEEPEPLYGDLLRTEIALRKTGGWYKHEKRTEWFQWLELDELKLLLGTWLFSARILHGYREVSKHAVIDFRPTNEEFEHAARAYGSSALQVTLTRLAVARGAPVGLHQGKTLAEDAA